MRTLTVVSSVLLLQAIASVIEQGQAEGSFRRDVVPFEAARAVFGALDGLALTWALGPAHRGSLARAGGEAAALFLQGLARR